MELLGWSQLLYPKKKKKKKNDIQVQKRRLMMVARELKFLEGEAVIRKHSMLSTSKCPKIK